MYSTITNRKTLHAIADKLIDFNGPIALDLEATSTDARTTTLVGLSISISRGKAIYIPVGHTTGKQLTWDDVDEILGDVLRTKSFVFHNAAYDTRLLHREEYLGQYPKVLGDTMLLAAAYGLVLALDLKSLQSEILGWTKSVTYKSVTGRTMGQLNPSEASIEDATKYAGADADATLQLWNHPTVQESKKSFIYELEMEVMPIAREMEETGWAVDTEFMYAEAERLKAEHQKGLLALAQIISKRLGITAGKALKTYKPFSYHAIAELIYDKLGYEVVEKTNKGNPSTGEDALTMIDDPIATMILSLRSMHRQANHFFEKFADIAVESGGRIYASYNQVGASSGRWSSSGPNLQNIPRRKTWKMFDENEEPYEVSTAARRGFVATPEHILLHSDYAQQELRFTAGLAQEQNMLRLFFDREDVHSHTAAELMNISVEDVTPEERFIGKTCNFALLYGGSPHRLYLELEGRVTPAEAEDLYSAFFHAYPALPLLHSRVKAKAKKTKSVTTYFGRRQLIPELFMAYDPTGKGDRAGVNRIVQGSCADMLKIGIVRLARIREKKYKGVFKFISAQHDAIIIEIDEDKVDMDELVNDVGEAMTVVLPDYPVFRVEPEIGPNWDEFEAYEGYVDDHEPIIENLNMGTLRKPDAAQREDITEHILEIDHQLTMDEASAIQELLDKNPGSNCIVIRQPDGEEIPCKTLTSLIPTAQCITEIVGDVEVSDDALTNVLEETL